MQNKTIDRITPPEVMPLRRVSLPDIERLTLDNGVPVYLVPFGSQELVEIRLTSRGGKSFESLTGSAAMTANMLMEGTESYSGLEFAQTLDEYGAFMRVDSGYESGAIGLTTLEKHLENTVPLLAELALRPSFPEAEFIKLRTRTIQHMEVERKKTAFGARREFSRLLYGKNHPYGMPIDPEHLEVLEIQNLIDFHKQAWSPANWHIVVSGKFDRDKLLGLLNENLGQAPAGEYLPPASSGSNQKPGENAYGRVHVDRPESLQATVRVGHRGFKRTHPDFYAMQVVTTIFGGYFGSRLMSNIREEKGYTYGIYSGWIGLKYNGTFLIQTDVANAYVEPTLKEIRYELDRLIKQGTTQEELDLVRNYMLGKIISSMETPSQIADLINSSIVNQVPFSRLEEKFDVIQSITPQQVRELCEKYYQPDKLLEVVCGNVKDMKK